MEEQRKREESPEPQNGLPENQKLDKKEAYYIRHVLLKKAFKRFRMIIVPEIVISLLLYYAKQLGLIRVVSVYFLSLIVGLVTFWGLMLYLARKNRLKTHKIRHYYLCNAAAYCMVLLVVLIVYWCVSRTEAFPDRDDYIFFPMFRLSLVFALMDDGQFTAREIPLSLAAFHGITFALIMLEPSIAVWYNKIRFRLGALKSRIGKKKHKRSARR